MLRVVKILILVLLAGASAKAQTFPNSDSIRSYIDKNIRNSAINAFQNLRLNTALKALVDRTDSVEAKVVGGVRVVDSIWIPNDTTLRYSIKGVTYSKTLPAGNGEIASASYGLLKTGTVFKADTTKLSTIFSLRDSLRVIRESGIGGGEVVKQSLGIIKNADTLRTNYPFVTSAASLRVAPAPLSTTLYKRKIGVNVRDYIYNPSDNTTPDDSVMNIRGAGGGTFTMVHDFVDPVDFGAVPNDGNDDTYYIQKAVDYAIRSGKVKRVYFGTIGQYLVNNLVLAHYVSGQATPFSLSLEGAMISNALGVSFKNTNPNSATIHIQLGLGVDIRNISFEGVGPDVPNFITAEDAEWSSSGVIRTNRKAPNAAINIDGLYKAGAYNSTLSTGDYYPGMTSWYTNEVYGGSTNINITNCNFSRMFVGIAEGLSGVANGEGIHVDGGQGIFVPYFWVAGQLQSRENTISNFYHIIGHTFISNNGWGIGNGDLPSVNNCNINYLKYLFEAAGGFTSPRFTTGYSEGIWSIGRNYAATPIVFDKWNLTMAANNVISALGGSGLTAKAPVILQSAGPFAFTNGVLQSDSYYEGFPFNAAGGVDLSGTRIQGGVQFQTNPDHFDNITYNNTTWELNGGGPRVLTENSYNESQDAEDASLNGYYLLPGSKFKGRKKITVENVGNRFDRIALGTHAVTVNTGTNTLTFTNTSGSIIAMYDVIVTPTAVDYTGDVYTSTGTTLGWVSGISGTTITLTNVPYGVVNSGSYDMTIVRVPKYIPKTIVTTTASSPVLTNALFNTGTFTAGDRIKGEGIPEGAIVTGTTSTTITMSVNATATANRVYVYDALIKQTADNKPIDYFGLTKQSDIANVWTAGDQIINTSGHPDSLYYGQTIVTNGKFTSATPPGLTTGSPITDENPFNSTVRAGTSELQGIATDNNLDLSNLYFDGSNIRYRRSGTGSYWQKYNGGVTFNTAPTGIAGAVAAPVVRLVIDASGSLKNNLSNTDYTNTAGAGSHYLMNNTNPSGQNVMTSMINGSIVAKWRTDYVGNVNWIAGGGSHEFWVNGDFGTGGIAMEVKPDSNVVVKKRAGTGIRAATFYPDGSIHDTTLALGGTTYTPGAGISIASGVISATDTSSIPIDGTLQYTGGNVLGVNVSAIGAQPHAIAVISNANYTLTPDVGTIKLVELTASKTVTLPAASLWPNRMVWIFVSASSSYQANFSQTLYTTPSATTTSCPGGKSMLIQSDGTVWQIVKNQD